MAAVESSWFSVQPNAFFSLLVTGNAARAPETVSAILIVRCSLSAGLCVRICALAHRCVQGWVLRVSCAAEVFRMWSVSMQQAWMWQWCYVCHQKMLSIFLRDILLHCTFGCMVCVREMECASVTLQHSHNSAWSRASCFKWSSTVWFSNGGVCWIRRDKVESVFVLCGSVDMWVCGDMGNGWTGWVIFARGWCVFSEFRSLYMSFGGKRVTAWAASCTVPLQYSSRVISAWSLKQCLLQKRKKRKLIHERERERERSVWVDKERAEYVWECLQYVLKRKAVFYRKLFCTSTVKERKKEKYIYIYIYKYINKEYMQSEQRKKERKKVYSLHNRHTQRKKTKERYALCRISDGRNTQTVE